MCGVEYFAHPWEFGPRKAKELLLTGDSVERRGGLPARHGQQDLPRRRARTTAPSSSPSASPQLPTMAALLIKESVNQRVDNMGFYNALNACFTIHELNHSHWAWVNEDRFPAAKEDAGIPNWRTAPPIVPAVKDKVRADGSRRPQRGPPVVRRAPFSDNPNVGPRGQRTQQRILDAALAVLRDEGYHRCAVDRISRLAGCSRVSFYQYFSGKEDVFRHLAEQVARQLNASTDRLDPVTPDERVGRDARVGRSIQRHLQPVRARVPCVPRGRRERLVAGRRFRARRPPLRRRHPLASIDGDVGAARARDGARAAAGVPDPDARRRRDAVRGRAELVPEARHARRVHRCGPSQPVRLASGGERAPASRAPPAEAALRRRDEHARRRPRFGGSDAASRTGAGRAARGGTRCLREPRVPRHPRRRHRGGCGCLARRVLPLLQEQGRARLPLGRAGHADGLDHVDCNPRRERRRRQRPSAAALAALVQPRAGEGDVDVPRAGRRGAPRPLASPRIPRQRSIGAGAGWCTSWAPATSATRRPMPSSCCRWSTPSVCASVRSAKSTPPLSSSSAASSVADGEAVEPN